jgi:hypothetical protein
MNYCYTLPPLIFVMGLITLLLTNCQPSAHTNDSITPLSTSLEGRWQADSARAFFYHPPHRFINKAKPLPIPGEMLTVQANRAIWHYAGYKDQEHIYTRRGNTLFVQQNLVGERRACRYHVDYQADYSFFSSARQYYRPWGRLSPRLVLLLLALKRQLEIVFYQQYFSDAFLINSEKSHFTRTVLKVKRRG